MKLNRVTIIIIVTGFVGFLQGIQRFLIPIALIHYDWSLPQYGAIYVFQALAMAFPMLLGGISTDLQGRKQTIAIGFILLGLGTITFMLALDGSNLLWLIVSQIVSTISFGITRIGLSTILVDETMPGFDRTNALGKQATSRNFTGFIGPVMVGSYIEAEKFGLGEMNTIKTSFLILALLSFLGVFLSFILPATSAENIMRNREASIADFSPNQKKMQLAFGVEEIIIGFTSGLIVPFIDYYILSEFDPRKDHWGVVFGISNSSIALGSFLVGRYAERFGKANTVLSINSVAPILALGIAVSPTFLWVSVFYILRTTFANAVHPAWESWFYAHVPETVRGRTMSVIQLSRRLTRAGGSAMGTVLFASMGTLLFPLGCLFYPFAMAIPRGVENTLTDE
ncbi:MAG: MFS transporter [Candidatus Kariarchaeaceae archaeon]